MIERLVAVLGIMAFVPGCTTHSIRHGSSPASPAYVSCVGQFTAFEPDYPWFMNWVDQDGKLSHDDGRSPRAVFRIVSPTNHAGRIVGVLYRDHRDQGTDLPPPPDLGDVGKTFSLELPGDFFAGNFVTIDSIHVRIQKVEPEPEAGEYRR